VLHLYFAEFPTPKGRLKLASTDPPGLEIEGVSLGARFEKYNFIKRRFQEIAVGRRIVARLRDFKPQAVIGSNLPLDALNKLTKFLRSAEIPFIFWQQDISSIAILTVFGQKYGIAGKMIGYWYKYLEGRAADESNAIIVIAADFADVLETQFGVRTSKIHVIENWAPLDDIDRREKINDWSLVNNFAFNEVVLYTGTLGLKHDPRKLLAVAEALSERTGARLVITSEGPSAEWLSEQANVKQLRSLNVLPFQPFEQYPNVLGAADVLISTLEEEAGAFSVPSKILSYLCAGRPIVLSAPKENLAAKIIERANAGIVVAPHDTVGFIYSIKNILDHPDLRRIYSINARRYAEETFDIARIGDRFECIIKSLF
jgi:glycosyltransferase involved in cell wall biosynthesis